MLLRHIYIYLDLEEWPERLHRPVGFESRCVCNFIEQRLKQLRYHTEGFSKLVVTGTKAPIDECPVESVNAVCPTVVFDEQRFLVTEGVGRLEYFMELLTAGFNKCAQFHSIPLQELLSYLEEFRRGGYRNEWVHKRRTFRGTGLSAELCCCLTMDYFSLNLRVESRDAVIFDQEILRDLPDELIFDYRFRDIELKNDRLRVTSKVSNPLLDLDLSSMAVTLYNPRKKYPPGAIPK